MRFLAAYAGRLMVLGIIASILASSLAAAVPFQIQGYVKDANGVPVVNANLHLEVIDNRTQTLPYDFEAVTNSDGYYSVWPGINEPGDCLGYSGDYVQVTATAGEKSGSAQVYIPYDSTVGVWQNLTVESPANNPLTGSVGLIVLGVIIATIVIFVLWLQARRKRQESAMHSNNAPKRTRRGRR